jgi:hypothetical protein
MNPGWWRLTRQSGDWRSQAKENADPSSLRSLGMTNKGKKHPLLWGESGQWRVAEAVASDWWRDGRGQRAGETPALRMRAEVVNRPPDNESGSAEHSVATWLKLHRK